MGCRDCILYKTMGVLVADEEGIRIALARVETTLENLVENVGTLFKKIDEDRAERAGIVSFQEQTKGFLKAITFGISITQAVVLAFMIWLISSVSMLREKNSVLEYRIQQVECRK